MSGRLGRRHRDPDWGLSLGEAVVVGDEVTVHHRMRLTLSADHRIIDGALAAQFLQTLTRLLESPWTVVARGPRVRSAPPTWYMHC